ncbi:hypothetical protein LTR50_002959 [Elasticomyces elasticus]|nr:hypothetical protein LTR50_002959 [Elasticomyces elasticus]
MTSFLLSKLANALGIPTQSGHPPNLAQKSQSKWQDQRVSKHKAVAAVLLERGLDEATASHASKNELDEWDFKDVHGVFNKIRASPEDVRKGLRSFKPTAANDDAASSTDHRPNYFVTPSLALVERAAHTGMALCVNVEGEFALKERDYLALSHVWSEGVGADLNNKGLPRYLISRLFERTTSLGVQWIWLDSLAIPGGTRTLTVHEEDLKVEMINCMADIYRKATAVVIIDALVLRLQSNHAVDVAVALICGKWITRIWTYQEIKLATRAVIVTGAGTVEYSDMLNTLRDLAGPNAMSGTQRGSRAVLYRRLVVLQRDDQLGISLPDIAMACGYRKAGVDIDYARAFFPTLGLEWKARFTREDGMRVIYESQRDHASRLVLWHGPPRCQWPGWAPASFNDLQDALILDSSVWKRRGLSRSWYSNKVRKLVPSKPGSLILELDDGRDPGALTCCLLSKTENPKSIQEFEKAVEDGTAYILADQPLYPKASWPYVAVLAERFITPREQEAWVCLTAAVIDTEPSYTTSKSEWLLLHENPISELDTSGKFHSELHYMIAMSEETEGSAETGETALHIAAYRGDIAKVREQLDSGMSVHSTDERGWTPLHSAASAGQYAIVPILVDAGADLEVVDKNDGRTPLVLAADKGHCETIRALVEAGADPSYSHEKGWSPLNTAIISTRIGAVKLLLELGVDPSIRDAGGSVPLVHAVMKVEQPAIKKSIEQDQRPSTTVDILLDAGADPNVTHCSGLSPIDAAARGGQAYAIQRLIDHGAEVEPNGAGENTPLYHAVKAQHEEAVQILCDNGADTNAIVKDGWTPFAHAIQSGNLNIIRRLRAAGGNLNVRYGADELTLLHIAAVEGHAVVIKWLAAPEQGLNVAERDGRGRTARELVAEMRRQV